jgi:monofunctional biosynthetic peptidoglycan transglycosylase
MTKPPSSEPRRRPFLRILALLACALFAWLGVEALLWPDVAGLAATNPSKTEFMRRYETRHGGAVRFEWLAYGAVSDHLKRAVLVAEDIDFFSHDGFAYGELRQAVRDAIANRKLPRGASTITQQVAKNLWLSPARTPRRKLREALLTRALERHLEKRRILEIYLNVAEFGGGAFGCEAASRQYFGKSARHLSPPEAARLAAVLPRPSRWRPDGTSAGFLAAVDRIERRVRKAQWLSRVI